MAGRRRPNARRGGAKEKTGNEDNAKALKITAVIVGIGLFFALIVSLGSGDGDSLAERAAEEAAKRGKGSDRLAELEALDGGEVRSDRFVGAPSTQPERLTKAFIVAIATEDIDAVEKLIDFPRLFLKLATENKWDESKKWENLDEAGQEALKQDWMVELLDPDVKEVVEKFLKDDILANVAAPNRNDTRYDFGLVRYIVLDDLDRETVTIDVKSYLRKGFNPKTDKENPAAWAIVDVKYQIHRTLNTRKKSKKKDVGASLGKVKKKRKRRRFTGPVEADVAVVKWVEGTNDATKGKINGLIKTGLSNAGRDSHKAQQRLIEIGKPALPGLLNAITAIDYKQRSNVPSVRFLIDTIEQITGEVQGVTGSTNLGGLTGFDGDAIEKGLRRWFGWWTNFGPKWVRNEYDPSKETWEQLEDEDEEGDEGKK